MKNFSKLFFLAWLISAVSFAYGQAKPTLQADAPTEFESVWLWRVNTPTRIIYIAGEQHDYPLAPHERLSHKLAYAGYESSSRVLLEGFNLNGRDSNRQLKDRLTAETWETLSDAVRKAMAIKLRSIEKLTDEQRATPADEFVTLINRWTDFSLLTGLPGLLLPLPDKAEPYKVEQGFLAKITKEQSSVNFKKIGFLELRNNVDQVWLDQCGQPQDTEQLVKKTLAEIDKFTKFPTNLERDFLNEFINPLATEDSIVRITQNRPMADVLDRCTVLPRNLQWVEKIKQELVLDKSTQPLMIVVGLGHVVGNTGLLQLLCKEGYCQSQRVLQLNLPQ